MSRVQGWADKKLIQSLVKCAIIRSLCLSLCVAALCVVLVCMGFSCAEINFRPATFPTVSSAV